MVALRELKEKGSFIQITSLDIIPVSSFNLNFNDLTKP